MPGVAGRSGGKNAKRREQLALEGTYRPDRHGGSASPDYPPGAPDMPGPLTGEGLAEWHRMTERLEMTGALSKVDGAALYRYCQLWARAMQVEKEVAALDSLWFFKVSVDGAGVEHKEPRVHPLITQARQYDAALRPYWIEFGLTPASRGRVRLPEKVTDPDWMDEFEGPKLVE